MLRKIFISPFNLGYFDALNSIDDIDLLKKYTPDINFNTFIYSSLIQTGTNFIETSTNNKDLFNKSETIRRRIIQSDDKIYGKISNRIEIILNKYQIKIKVNKKINSEFVRIKLFLTDLLYSFNRGSDFLFTLDLPNIVLIKNYFQHELYYPLNNLFSKINTENIFIPSAISVITKSEINKFESLLNSDIYVNYSDTQKSLDTKKFINVFKELKLSVEKLVACNPNLLIIYNNLTKILPISKLINKDLGDLAEFTKSVYSDLSLTNSKQNIIIYMYKDLLFDRLKTKIDISTERFGYDLIKWTKEALQLISKSKIPPKQHLKFLKKYVHEQEFKLFGRKLG